MMLMECACPETSVPTNGHWVVPVVAILYFMGEMIISFFFNHKIAAISKGKWNIAAWSGFFATFLHIGLTILSVILGDHYNHMFGGHGYWVIPLITTTCLALGNFTTTQLMGLAEKRKKNKKAGKKVKK